MSMVARVDWEAIEAREVKALELFREGARWVREAEKVTVLTGAGISVESGVPDFRSPRGVWAKFPIDEYGTIQAFHENPVKAWKLYRAIWKDIEGKEPNPAHLALSRLEEHGHLAGVVTQNIDNLHHKAGTRNVIEIHGDSRNLQCVYCGWVGLADVKKIMETEDVPRCPNCNKYVKPNVVFFGEDVRGIQEIEELLQGSDLMLVIGTSANVFPANTLPLRIKNAGGKVIEFNLKPSALSEGAIGLGFWSLERSAPDLLVLGPAGKTLPAFVDLVIKERD